MTYGDARCVLCQFESRNAKKCHTVWHKTDTEKLMDGGAYRVGCPDLYWYSIYPVMSLKPNPKVLYSTHKEWTRGTQVCKYIYWQNSYPHLLWKTC
jgi:hypothetical protein